MLLSMAEASMVVDSFDFLTVISARSTQGSAGGSGNGGRWCFLSFSISQIVGGEVTFGASGFGLQRISKPSRMREYSQALSSQPQPAGSVRSGRVGHSA